MCRFEPRRLNPRTTNLIIGTSRTKYIKANEVDTAIHSYRGANLSELSHVIERYPHQQLSTVIVVAGFNDHRKSPAIFVENWKYIIQLIYWKFNHSTVIIPKTIATANDSITNRRIYWLNFALHKLLGSLNPPIVSPNFNHDFDTKIFCRDGVHFSFFGNHIFTRILSFYISHYSCNFIHM